MIAHALDIIQKELQANLDSYPVASPGSGFTSALNNIAVTSVSSSIEPNTQADILITLINIREDKSLKNVPAYVRNDVTLKVIYENPPVFANFLLLFSVIHNAYPQALSALSRVIRFFQYKNVFTHDNVAPATLISAVVLESDRLEEFKLILDLYSPTLEEVNHLWGTLGGKQYPFVLYTMRMLDLKYKGFPQEGPLVTEVFHEFRHK
jgi:Pvc16 N-terminal domain